MANIEENTALSGPYYETSPLIGGELKTEEVKNPSVLEKAKESRGKPRTRLFPTRADKPFEKSPLSDTRHKINLPYPSEIESNESYTSILVEIMKELEKIQKEMANHANTSGEISAGLAEANISLLKEKMKAQDLADGSISYLRKIASLISGFLGGALLASESPVAKLAGGCLVGSCLLSSLSNDLKDSGSSIDLSKLEMAAGSLAFIGNGVGALSGETAFRGTYLGLLMKVTGASTALISQAYAKKKADYRIDSVRLTSNIEEHKRVQKEAESISSSLNEDEIHIIGAIVRTLDNEIDSIKQANRKQIQG
jgi:hypothetical protein